LSTTAVIGRAFTFQVRFVDGTGTPIDPPDPTITVFRFSGDSKVLLIDAAAMFPADPVEVGRYVYPYTIPDTLEDGDTIYGDMAGTGAEFVEVEVSLLAPDAERGRVISRFVRGG